MDVTEESRWINNCWYIKENWVPVQGKPFGRLQTTS